MVTLVYAVLDYRLRGQYSWARVKKYGFFLLFDLILAEFAAALAIAANAGKDAVLGQSGDDVAPILVVVAFSLVPQIVLLASRVSKDRGRRYGKAPKKDNALPDPTNRVRLWTALGSAIDGLLDAGSEDSWLTEDQPSAREARLGRALVRKLGPDAARALGEDYLNGPAKQLPADAFKRAERKVLITVQSLEGRPEDAVMQLMEIVIKNRQRAYLKRSTITKVIRHEEQRSIDQ